MMGDGDTRPGAPGGGAHELQFDRQGNVIVGMDNGTVKYDPETGRFTSWSAGRAMFGLDPDGNVWNLQRNGDLAKIDTSSDELKKHDLPDSEEQGNLRHRHRFQGSDPSLHLAGRQDRHLRSEDGPIRRVPDAHAHVRSAARADRRPGSPVGGEFYAGQLMMFDPDKKVIKEYPLINGTKPYTAPYAEPYSASADDKNQIVWTHDFSSSRLYRIDMNTGQSTEYHDAVELRGARFEGRHRGRAPDRVGSGLSSAIQAGEDSGSVIQSRRPAGSAGRRSASST